MSFRPLVRIALVALPLAFTAAGCDVMDYLSENNPLETKKKPIDGDRKPVFPGGVPGIEYNQPPPQPTNSNIPLSSVPPPQQEQPAETPQNARQQARPARAVQRQAPNATGDDPWSDARPRPPGGQDPWAESPPVR